mmetsp:Transcript_63762/g.152021  ORF Transcript_63762/g.152021 Transcript_63762/m.152021 type:complete len:693 (-) Transcript_63762:160-2238(-)
MQVDAGALRALPTSSQHRSSTLSRRPGSGGCQVYPVSKAMVLQLSVATPSSSMADEMALPNNEAPWKQPQFVGRVVVLGCALLCGTVAVSVLKRIKQPSYRFSRPRLAGAGPASVTAAAAQPARQRHASGASTQKGAPAVPWQTLAVRMCKRLFGPGPFRARTWIYMAMLMVSLVLGNCVEVMLSYAQRDYMTALQHSDTQRFMHGLFRALALISIHIPLSCLEEFSTGGLSITWRDTLTRGLLGKYFHPRAVHWLRCSESAPDPDTRIAIEAGHFSDAAVLLVRDVVENAMRLVSFIGIVYTISARLCLAMIAYAGLGALVTVSLFGRPLVSKDRDIRAKEASFRSSLARVYDNAEALAFAQGEDSEAYESQDRFQVLRRQLFSRLKWRTGLSGFRNFFSSASTLIPLAMVSHLWLSGKVPFGVLAQSVTAFTASFNALSVVIRKFRSVSSLIAEGGRLEILDESLSRVQAAEPEPPLTIGGSGASVKDLTLRLPSGEELVRNLSFAVRPGQRLLLMGDSGCGKTTLLRSLAGLWTSGLGEVQCSSSAVFLPQDPYMPQGTLKRVLTFPLPPEAMNSDAVLAAAKRAQLQDVLRRYSLDKVADWEAVLSRGEQQRCAFCRLILQKPQLAVLDEATSALDEDVERALYSALEVPTVISVGHRASLVPLHTHLLRCKSQEWALEAIKAKKEGP